MEQAQSLFESWAKTQRDMIDAWSETAEKVQRSLAGIMNIEKSGNGALLNPLTMYASWLNTMTAASDEMAKRDADVVRDIFSKLLNNTGMYLKFYELWMPVIQSLSQKMIDPDNWQDHMDPDKLREMIDEVINKKAPELTQEFYDQSSKYIETWGSSAEKFVKPWAEACQKNIQTLPKLASGDVESDVGSMMGMFHNLFKAFFGTFGEIFKFPPVGKDREKVELLLTSLDKYAVYMAKNMEYQHLIFIPSKKAMEKISEKMVQMIKDGEEVKSFDDFLDLWININEKSYLELFHTDEFSRVQGELLQASLDVRTNLHKLMELVLADFPIALRSEMDDAYKTIYELKRTVRKIERSNIGELRSQMQQMSETMAKMQERIDGLERAPAAVAAETKTARPTAGNVTAKTVAPRKAAPPKKRKPASEEGSR